MSKVALSRRALLIAGSGALACSPRSLNGRETTWPDQLPSTEVDPQPRFSDSLDALFDVLVPAELAPDGRVVSPGARELGVDAVLRTTGLARLAVAQGWVPVLPEAVLSVFDVFGATARAQLNAQLDALASAERPLTRFSALPRAMQEAVVDRAYDEPALRPWLLVIRAASFNAFLGGGASEAGLVALGFPPFENFADGLAVSGYPRMKNGQLDDYTYNRAPQPSEDLSMVMTPEGDLR